VNNAGTAVSAPAVDMPVDEFRAMVESDLASPFALTELVGRAMIDAGRGSTRITCCGTVRRPLSTHGIRVNARGPPVRT
jgi:NAD(P)-dependent dehydrogenase (short-subunit alcohol dehydrogenase family)